MRDLIKSLVLAAPPLRRVFEQRDAALAELAAIRSGSGSTVDAREAVRAFVATFAFAKRGLPPLSSMSDAECNAILQEMGWRAFARGAVDAIAASERDSWFRVLFNGVRLTLPRYTLMTMRHCIFTQPDGTLKMEVETRHWEKLRDELTDGALFLDVGAATGAMSIPFDLSVKKDIAIVAFEPSRRARDWLTATAERNGATRVTVSPLALSDAAGSFEFFELPEDETGDTPFLPEGSRLRAAGEGEAGMGVAYPVTVSTLDAFMATEAPRGRSKLVIKVDVEGFEDKVLTGGLETIARHRPFFAIDIHNFPGRAESTGPAVRAIAERFPYTVEQHGHVMVLRPQ
jgi:FkbM family methyltransferase